MSNSMSSALLNAFGRKSEVSRPVTNVGGPVESRTALESLYEMARDGRIANLAVNHGLMGADGEVIVTRLNGLKTAFSVYSARDPRARETILDIVSAENAAPQPVIPDKPSTDMLRAMQVPEMVAGDGRQELAVQVEDLLGYTRLRKSAQAPSRLQRVLRDLDITPFDQASVDEYKKRMQKHFQAKLQGMGIDIDPQKAYGLKRSLLDHFASRAVAWSNVELKDYDKPVPEFVLRKALQVKQAAPDARFFVDELREERRTLDPFLVVKIGDDTAAIEVWDEPEFEKTL